MATKHIWIDELDGQLSTMHLFNFEIQVYKDPLDSGWHLTCSELSWNHKSLPSYIKSLDLAKKESLERVRERLLFIAEEIDLILSD